jgi:purine catabolism regulator
VEKQVAFENRAFIAIEPRAGEEARVRAALHRVAPSLGVEIAAGTGLAGLMRSGRGGPRHTAVMIQKALAELLGLDPGWICVGGFLSEARGVRQSQLEAEKAIRLGRILFAEPRVVLYEDVLGLAAIEADRWTLARLASILEPVVGHDARRKNKPLMETLEAFFEAELSARAAARRLGIHRHTLDYRMRQIERLLGRSVRKAPDRLLVEMALLAGRITSKHAR